MKRFITASAVLFAACGFGYTAPEPPTPAEATQVDATMGRTWDAVIDLFAARTIPINTIERVSGIIVTERLSVGAEGRAWADCGKIKNWSGSGHIRPNYATYNVLVRGDSAQSSVRVTMRWVYQEHLIDGPTECSTKHVFERQLEAEIKTHAEEPKLASDPRAEPPVKPSGTAAGPPPEVQAPPTSAGTANSSTTTSGYAPPQTTAAGGRASSRPNAELLGQPDFTRAIHDLQALRFLAGFQEVGADSLQVEVSDDAITTDLSEYNLGRLFSAYFRITNWNIRTTVLYTHSGQLIGTYTRSGLVIRQ